MCISGVTMEVKENFTTKALRLVYGALKKLPSIPTTSQLKCLFSRLKNHWIVLETMYEETKPQGSRV